MIFSETGKFDFQTQVHAISKFIFQQFKGSKLICISLKELVFPAFNIIWDCFGLDFWFLKFLIVFIIKTLIQILSVIMNGVWSRGSTHMAGYAMWPI